MKKSHILPMERWKFVFYFLLALALAPLVLIISWTRRRCVFVGGGAPRVLIIPIMTRVGDFVCASVAFRAFKLQYPKAHLSVLVGKKIIELTKTIPRVDVFININSVPFKGFWGRGRFFLYLLRQKFDAVVCLTNNPFNNLVAWFSATPMRVKTVVLKKSQAERFSDILTNRHFTYETGTFLQDHYIKLLQFLGVPFSPPIKELKVTEDGERKAEEFFRINGFVGKKLIVGITPSAGHKAKEWPIERFGETASALIERYGAEIILIDSSGNKARLDAVLTSMDEARRRSVFVAHDFSLDELPSLIKRLNILIAVDTGNIYIAHALGVPIIDIVGPVHPDEQPPNDEKSVQVCPPKEFSPVFFVLERPSAEAYEIAPRVIDSIGSEAVLDAFKELVNRRVVYSNIPVLNPFDTNVSD